MTADGTSGHSFEAHDEVKLKIYQLLQPVDN